MLMDVCLRHIHLWVCFTSLFFTSPVCLPASTSLLSPELPAVHGLTYKHYEPAYSAFLQAIDLIDTGKLTMQAALAPLYTPLLPFRWKHLKGSKFIFLCVWCKRCDRK